MTELRCCKHCGEKPQLLKKDSRVAHACRVLDRELRMTVDEWNTENESATGVLRRLLDERGVEWKGKKSSENGSNITFWVSPDDLCVADYFESGYVHITMENATPEQAIAATLGGGELAAEQERVAELEASVRAHERGMREAWAEYEKRDELIRDMWSLLPDGGASEAFAERMRELGIEVGQ